MKDLTLFVRVVPCTCGIFAEAYILLERPSESQAYVLPLFS